MKTTLLLIVTLLLAADSQALIKCKESISREVRSNSVFKTRSATTKTSDVNFNELYSFDEVYPEDNSLSFESLKEVQNRRLGALKVFKAMGIEQSDLDQYLFPDVTMEIKNRNITAYYPNFGFSRNGKKAHYIVKNDPKNPQVILYLTKKKGKKMKLVSHSVNEDISYSTQTKTKRYRMGFVKVTGTQIVECKDE